MKRLIVLILMLFVVATISIAGDRNISISTGYTMPNNFTLNASDTINADDTITFNITNKQKYAQMQYFTVGLTDVSGTPNVAITAYGKITPTSSWVQIGSPITWTSDSNNGTIASTTPINYNYLKVVFIATSTTQQTLINVFEVKTTNAFDVPVSSGTLTISRPTSGVVTITSADNDANAALTVSAGGTGALTVGDANSTAAIASSDWAISATGAVTGVGAITSDGAITSASYNFATPAMVTGSGDSIRVTNASLPTLAAGIELSFLSEAANTTAVRFDYNGAVKDLQEYNGAISALDANDIRSGQYVKIAYDGTRWVMLSPSGN